MRKLLAFACLTAILMAVHAMAQDDTSPANAIANNTVGDQHKMTEGQAAVGVVALQASWTPNVARHDRSTRVEGLAVSMWGENPQTALAVGLVNGSVGESKGLSFGVFNYAESYEGLHWGFANFAEKDFSGWQGGPLLGVVVSFLNYTGGNMKGLQTGVVNLTGELTGVQVGIVNYAQTSDSGVQVGIVNILAQNIGWFDQWPNEVAPGMVFVNWRF